MLKSLLVTYRSAKITRDAYLDNSFHILVPNGLGYNGFAMVGDASCLPRYNVFIGRGYICEGSTDGIVVFEQTRRIDAKQVR